jgi:hypothetical protein
MRHTSFTFAIKLPLGQFRLVAGLSLIALMVLVGLLQLGVFSGRQAPEDSGYIAPVLDPQLYTQKKHPPQTALQSTETTLEQELSPQQQAYVNHYFNSLKAGQTIKHQLSQLQELTRDEQQQAAEQILQQAESYFTNKQISQSEWLFLKLTTMRHLLSPEDFKEYAQHEISHYEQQSQQKWQEYLNNRSPEFIDYKQKERELVQRILQMSSFPDGLTREQYLRQEIEKLKAQAYGYEKTQEG